jgi:PTS system nitrogen regulatory IIA component
MGKPGAGMEIYLTIEGLAEYLKLAEQTIRRWVLNHEIPFCKIRKVIRFRVSEIEKWIDNGGACMPSNQREDSENDLFGETEVQELIEGVEETEGGV